MNSKPILPDKCGVILAKLSLYSLSTERPNANEITLFLPNRNLKIDLFLTSVYLFRVFFLILLAI